MALGPLKGTHSPTDALRQFAEDASRSTSTRTKLMTGVVLKAGTGKVEVQHGMGQLYTGVLVLGVSQNTLVVPALPKQCSEPDKLFALYRSSPTDITVNVLLFF